MDEKLCHFFLLAVPYSKWHRLHLSPFAAPFLGLWHRDFLRSKAPAPAMGLLKSSDLSGIAWRSPELSRLASRGALNLGVEATASPTPPRPDLSHNY